MIEKLRKEIRLLKNPAKAKILQRFFKTGKGEYGEGDIFFGIMLPQQRDLVKIYWNEINLQETQILLKSKIHEERLIALLILVEKYKRGDEKQKKIIYKFYLSHAKFVNNWDLVDLSAPNIVGEFLINSDPSILFKLTKSKNLWEKRIAILATLAFIKKGISQHTLKIAKILLNDKHDLIHKAVGWMLREVGKRCKEQDLTNFLNTNYKHIPRTTLRYAIERLPDKTRKYYLNLNK